MTPQSPSTSRKKTTKKTRATPTQVTDLYPRLSEEDRAEERRKGHHEVPAAHAAQVEGHVGHGREQEHPHKSFSLKQPDHPHLSLGYLRVEIVGRG